jgi:hypothetical protein
MAGKPKPMSQIKQLLLLHQQGKGIKFIARSLCLSKNTVKAYLAKTALLPLSVEQLLSLANPLLEAKYHAGSPAYKDTRFDHFKENSTILLKSLKG